MNHVMHHPELVGNWKNFSSQELDTCLELLPDKELMSGIPVDMQRRWMAYLYSAPKQMNGSTLHLRNHVICLYDPFAKRKTFPAGLRFCVNVYTGCEHVCRYCYIAGYIVRPFKARPKIDFRKKFLKDVEEIQRLGVNPAPLHMSNSTDPLQPLENFRKDTLWTLRNVAELQHLFTSITILTKNPALLTSEEYLPVCKDIENLRVEVSCSFFREESKTLLESNSPDIQSRLCAMELLRKHDIKVALRLDPLFPREPLPEEYVSKPRLEDYGAPVGPTEEDIHNLIKFAAGIRCYRVIVSPMKLIFGKYHKTGLTEEYLPLYKALGGGTAIKRGSAYRMPDGYASYLFEYPRKTAMEYGIEIMQCKQSLISTK